MTRVTHIRGVVETWPAMDWIEMHGENYFADGGPSLRLLDRVRAEYPLSLHGVGLSLGSCDPLSARSPATAEYAHRTLRTRPGVGAPEPGRGRRRHTNDLPPLPYTEEACTFWGILLVLFLVNGPGWWSMDHFIRQRRCWTTAA